ncbi:MAG: lipoprotein [Betaproteobacteria bacterium]|nr:lipoprotein [Betaproteobacteria bacterium]
MVMQKVLRRLKSPMSLALLLAVAGCGTKGALFLPKPVQPQSTQVPVSQMPTSQAPEPQTDVSPTPDNTENPNQLLNLATPTPVSSQ